MKSTCVLFVALVLAGTGSTAAEPTPGKLTGGIVYSLPEWFKSDFLDFQNDIEEARRRDKHVMALLHLDECPYCARMLEENFINGDARKFIETNFDVIAINIRGDLELTWIDGATYTERELTRHLNVIATPTIVFLGLDGNKVLQLSGYRDPRALRYALEYVQSKRYRSEPFADYLATQNKPEVYEFREHPRFARTTYFKGYDKPLAILFEDRYCAECDRFHDTTLNHPNVVAAMKPFLFVRLDADSDQRIVELDGKVTTPTKWVKSMGLTYRPAVVLFNEGREMFRADHRLYHQHFAEALRYVGGEYRQYDTLAKFKAAYREELLRKGIDVDFSEKK